jgi:hypothetical protein
MKSIIKNQRVRIFRVGIALLSLVVASVFMQGCSSSEEEANFIDHSELETADFRNWFNSQQIESGLVEKNGLNWDNAEIKLMPDGKSKKVTFIIYQGENSLGNDSIRELHIAYVRNSFMGGIMAFSYSSKVRARVEQYDLKDQLEREWAYYVPKQVFSLLKIYPNRGSIVRLKLGSENDGCPGEIEIANSATPYINNDGTSNPDAFNCHAYIWGPLQPTDPNYAIANEPGYPLWNNWPNIADSGWSEVSTPQVGDRWVSFTDDIVNGENLPWHSARVVEVINGKVTKVEAKCGDGGIWIYDPECNKYVGYTTNILKYYHSN